MQRLLMHDDAQCHEDAKNKNNKQF
jgi:hypothetical protein